MSGCKPLAGLQFHHERELAELGQKEMNLTSLELRAIEYFTIEFNIGTFHFAQKSLNGQDLPLEANQDCIQNMLLLSLVPTAPA